MEKSSYISILAIILFVLIIWTINNTILFNLFNSNISRVNNLRAEVHFKRSFSQQKSAFKLNDSINSIATDRLDKIALTDAFARFASESSVTLLDSSIKENQNRGDLSSNVDNNNLSNSATDSTVFQSQTRKNTFKIAQISLKISGQQSGINSFIDKMMQYPQYIDIISINLDRTQSGNEISGTIVAIIYYKGL